MILGPTFTQAALGEFPHRILNTNTPSMTHHHYHHYGHGSGQNLFHCSSVSPPGDGSRCRGLGPVVWEKAITSCCGRTSCKGHANVVLRRTEIEVLLLPQTGPESGPALFDLAWKCFFSPHWMGDYTCTTRAASVHRCAGEQSYYHSCRDYNSLMTTSKVHLRPVQAKCIQNAAKPVCVAVL